MRRLSGVRDYGAKIDGVPAYANEALMAWGSDNSSMSFREIIDSQMGRGSNPEAAKHAETLERMLQGREFKKDIWRGVSMTEQEFSQLKEGFGFGQHNARNALSSWSESNGVALEFATANAHSAKGSVPVLFVMKGGTKSGMSISKHAERDNRGWEKEVLVSQRSKLDVTFVSDKLSNAAGSFYIVEVKER